MFFAVLKKTSVGVRFKIDCFSMYKLSWYYVTFYIKSLYCVSASFQSADEANSLTNVNKFPSYCKSLLMHSI